MSMKRINTLIQEAHPEVTLVKGEGYFYYVFDNLVEDKSDLPDNSPQVYKTESVMTPKLGDMSIGTWVAMGVYFGDKIKEESAA